ncbi:hypothetical protein [Acrocarpospora sp. B8E8]|uniref:hypothetical protein n=1 Tax=Acrocarpospora sp. B8E8 TaxID=3153572 RepID=UPI00325CA5BF
MTSDSALLVLAAPNRGLLVVAVLGAKIRWWLLPRVIRRERTSLIAWGSVEVAVIGLAYGIAVVLSRASTLI